MGSELPTYLASYADLLWREHAPAIRRADQAGTVGLRAWLEPIAQAFALTESELVTLLVVLSRRLREEALPYDPPPPKSRDELLFR